MSGIYSKKELALVKSVTLDQYFASKAPDRIESKGNNRYNIFWNNEWHTSLSILPPSDEHPHGFWSFFSQGESGKNALDWLCGMEGMSFPEACEELIGPPKERADETGEETRAIIEKRFGQVLLLEKKSEPQNNKIIELPERTPGSVNVKAYLEGRKINPGIIDYTIQQGFLWEDINRNCVFAGFNDIGLIKYASKRGTRSDFKGEVKNSDKRYAFKYENPIRRSAHFFEGPIDVMSYATYIKEKGFEWHLENLVSLGGIAGGTRNEIPEDKSQIRNLLPPAMKEFLDKHPKITTVYLHLDKDQPGRAATEKIMKLLKALDYKVLDEPSPKGKDWNDYITGKEEEEPDFGERKLNNRKSEES